MAGSVIKGVTAAIGGGQEREGYRKGRGEYKRANALAETLFSPYNKAGEQALGQFQSGLNVDYGDILSQLESDPFYQFQLQQGQNAIEGSAAAQGLLRSGRTLKGLNEFGQGLASQQGQMAYGRQLDRQNQLMQLMNAGLGAAGTRTNTALGAASGMAQLRAMEGESRANQTGAIGGSLQQLIGSAGAAFGAGGGGLKSFLSGGAF